MLIMMMNLNLEVLKIYLLLLYCSVEDLIYKFLMLKMFRLLMIYRLIEMVNLLVEMICLLVLQDELMMELLLWNLMMMNVLDYLDVNQLKQRKKKNNV